MFFFQELCYYYHMSEAPYISNLNSAIAYLKMGKRDNAREALNRALSQVPEEEKKSDNPSYIKLLSYLAAVAVGDEDYTSAARYIEEGLALKEIHADLLYMRLLVLIHRGAYNAMFPDVLKYLIACGAEDRNLYDCGFTTQEAIDKVMNEMLPLAYEHSTNHEAYFAAVMRYTETMDNKLLKRAHEIMKSIDITN